MTGKPISAWRKQARKDTLRMAISLTAVYLVMVGVLLALPGTRSNLGVYVLVAAFVFWIGFVSIGILALAVAWALLGPPLSWLFGPVVEMIREVRDDLAGRS